MGGLLHSVQACRPRPATRQGAHRWDAAGSIRLTCGRQQQSSPVVVPCAQIGFLAVTDQARLQQLLGVLAAFLPAQ